MPTKEHDQSFLRDRAQDNEEPEPVDFISRARRFTIEAHGEQVRKYTGEPYWHHCEEVAAKVALLTDDPEVIAAAWMHDVIEDTHYTYGKILHDFNFRIATLVVALTDVFTHADYPDRNRAWRKEQESGRLGTMPRGARLIKLCDVMSNAASIEEHGGKFAPVWLAEKKVLVAALLGGYRL